MNDEKSRDEMKRADRLAAALGLVPLGWASAHAAREHSLGELKQMCAWGAEAAASAHDAKAELLTLRIRPVYEDEDIDGEVTAEVYVPTPQCAELIRRNALVDAAGDAGSVALRPELKARADPCLRV